ncbi:MAG: hypothetical protein WDN00_03760 [Limisphaerales bacterium]
MDESISAFSSNIPRGSLINWLMVFGVLLKRYANRFVLPAEAFVLTAALPAANSNGALEAGSWEARSGLGDGSLRGRTMRTRRPHKPRAAHHQQAKQYPKCISYAQ